jgi:hypothetical protein
MASRKDCRWAGHNRLVEKDGRPEILRRIRKEYRRALRR